MLYLCMYTSMLVCIYYLYSSHQINCSGHNFLIVSHFVYVRMTGLATLLSHLVSLSTRSFSGRPHWKSKTVRPFWVTYCSPVLPGLDYVVADHGGVLVIVSLLLIILNHSDLQTVSTSLVILLHHSEDFLVISYALLYYNPLYSSLVDLNSSIFKAVFTPIEVYCWLLNLETFGTRLLPSGFCQPLRYNLFCNNVPWQVPGREAQVDQQGPYPMERVQRRIIPTK